MYRRFRRGYERCMYAPQTPSSHPHLNHPPPPTNKHQKPQFRIIATDRPTYNEDPEAMARGQMRPRDKDRNWARVKEDMQVMY